MKKKFLSLLTLLLCAVTGAWGQTTLISYTVTADDVCSSTDGGKTLSAKGTVAGTPGGTCEFYIEYSGSSVKNGFSSTAYRFGGGNGLITLTLASGTFQEGDEVSVTYLATNTNSTGYIVSSPKGSNTITSEGTTTKETHTKTITLDANFTGKNVIYIQRSGATMNVSNVTVTRSVTYSVTAQANNDSYGTVTADASVLAEGKTTTITATPSTGYKVTGWSVSGTGATISPSGTSSSLTATLTMGTADATVTCTFEAASTYSVTHSLTNVTTTSGATGANAATESIDYTAVFTEVPGYYLPEDITVTIGGATATKGTQYTWNSTTGEFTVPGSYVTGDIVVTIAGEAYVAPVSGTLFSLSGVGTGYSNSSDSETELTNITITGGRAYGFGTSSRTIQYSSNKINYAGNVNYIKLVLNYTLQDGDIISVTCDDNQGLNFISTNTNVAGNVDHTTYAVNGTPYTVKAGDDIVGSNIVYCWRRNGKSTNVTSITITRPEAISTLAGRNYATTVTTSQLDFGSTDGITAYIATGLNAGGTAVELTEVSVVPAGTPIIVKTETQGATVNVPVTTSAADDVSGNKLVAGDGTTEWNGTSGYDYYYLASDQFHKATSGTLQSGKAYLKVAAGGGAPSLSIMTSDIDGKATAIEGVKAVKTDGVYYNLNGQRVAQPTKGLYIVNGKKYIVK